MVLIVTWITYKNFGTYLQAYALQNILKTLGYDSRIADDSKIINEISNQLIGDSKVSLNKIFNKIKIIFSLSNYIYKYKERRSTLLYDNFKRDNLTIEYDVENLIELGNKYDTYLCGSDQIWFPSINIFHPFYYLNFTEKKKISYAPSIGTDNYPKEFINKIRELLNCFSNISVREKQGADILSKILNQNVPAVLDPTLLLSTERWNELISSSTNKKNAKYCICYFLTANKTYINHIKKYAKENKLTIKFFCINKNSVLNADESISAGPIEFLSEIKNASIIFTDSFHATIFSILFEKNFYTFQRFKNGEKMNQNSRLLNLFSLLDINYRFINEDSLETIGSCPEIDYNLVKILLNKEREKSIEFLKNALSK